TFSIATTERTASLIRKYATAETSTDTLSLVMIPCDWIGMVTIRSDTRCTRSTNGAMKIRPGPRAPSFTFPSRNWTPRSYCFRIRTDATMANNATTAMMMTATASMMIPSHQPGGGHRQAHRPIVRARLTNSDGQRTGGQHSRAGTYRSGSYLASVGP